MKKNQSGVSMVSLVITIIVIIILAAVAFTGSQETIGRAGFSGFTTDIDSVRTAFLSENVPNLMGEQTAKNNQVSEAQAYNFLAKGATTLPTTSAEHAWLSRAQAAAIPCTRIEKKTAKDALGIDLPVRTVNTYAATGVEMSYFITNKGDIFVWPPFPRSDDGFFYVNDTVKVVSGDGTVIDSTNESAMYSDGFSFVVNGVTIKTDKANEYASVLASGEAGTTANATTLKTTASVYYNDVRNAESAEGLESKKIYQDNNPAGVTGFDND